MLYSASKQGYINLWNKAVVLPQYENNLRAVVQKLLSNRHRYEIIEKATGVPWYWIACVHERESACNFNTYLGNGEPLHRVTRLVPKGRGPFNSWEDGAIDAIRYMGLQNVKDWTLSRALYEFERYNGWGYLNKINSPYVWSWTNLYGKGKYQENVEGSWYNANLKDPQPGCATMLKGLIKAGVTDPRLEVQVQQPSPKQQEQFDMGNFILSLLINPQVQTIMRSALKWGGGILFAKAGLDPSTLDGLIGLIMTGIGLAQSAKVHATSSNVSTGHQPLMSTVANGGTQQ